MSALVVFAAILIAALLFQGVLCLVRRERQNRVGILNLLLGAIGLFFWLAMESGTVVIAPELGVVMVQGPWTTFLLRLSLVIIAVCAALSWQSALAYARQPFRRRGLAILMGIALVCGLAASSQFNFVAIDGGLRGARPIAYFNMWFPPLMVWVLFCFSQSIAAIFARPRLLDCFRAACLVIAPVALFGLGWQEIADPYTTAAFTRAIWINVLYVAYAGVLGSLAWFAIQWSRRSVAAAVILVEAGLVVWAFHSPEYLYRNRLPGFLIVLGLLTAAQIAWAVSCNWGRSQRSVVPAYHPDDHEIGRLAYTYWESRARTGGSAEEDWQRAEATLRYRGLWTRYLLSFLLCLVAAGLFDFFYASLLSPWIDAAVAFFAWFLTTEFLAQGIVYRIPDWLVRAGRNAARGFEPSWTSLKNWRAEQRAKSSKDQPASGTAKTLRATVQIVAAVAALIAFSEVLHIGKTVLEPFAEPAGDDGKQQPGRQLSLLMSEELNQLRKDTELLVFSGKSMEAGRGDQRRLSRPIVAMESSNLASAISSSNELSIFGLKISPGFLVGIIQVPVRGLLGIDVISGSLFQETTEGASHLRAVVSSNTGQTWTATESPPSTGKACDGTDPVKRSPIESLAHELALQVVTSQPETPLTQSSTALDAFEKGIAHSQNFNLAGKRGELKMAVSCLQVATLVDPAFSDAYYRLALVLEQDGQPVRAAAALEAIGSNKPNYVRGLLQRANVLYTLKSFYPFLPPLLPPSVFPSTSQEAETIWLQIAEGNLRASASERRDAYLGLCQSTLDEESRVLGDIYETAEVNFRDSQPGQENRADFLRKVADRAMQEASRQAPFYLPYYYCKRAGALSSFGSMTDLRQADAQTLEASILNLLGLSIALHNQRTTLGGPTDLFCATGAIDVPSLSSSSRELPLLVWNSPIARMSIPYFASARRLAPDSLDIACSHATAVWNTSGDATPMLALKNNPRMALSLGESLGEAAHAFAYGSQRDSMNSTPMRQKELASLYYQMALNSFEDAIRVNDASVTALNDFAYYLWRWWVDSRKFTGLTPPTTEQRDLAEARIRKALQYVSPKATVEDRAYLLSTLGEVLIAKGDPSAAIAVLESLPPEVSDLEDQLDRAQAYACAAAAGLKDRSYAVLARETLAEAQKNEQLREFRPLSDQQWKSIDCQIVFPGKPSNPATAAGSAGQQ